MRGASSDLAMTRFEHTADANGVWAGLAVIMVMIFLEGPAGAQSGAEPVVTIPVHPGTSTIFFLPDEVLGIRLTADVAGLMAATYYDEKVVVRPLRGVPVGTEVTLAVKTATVKQRFLLRVVRHVRDASTRVVVAQAVMAEPAAEPAARTRAGVPALAKALAASPFIHVPRLEPPAAPEPALAVATEPARPAAAEGARARAVSAPRFDVSVHALAALGTTELTVPGYVPVIARRTHLALGVLLAVAPRGAWWAVALNVSGERLAGPTVHEDVNEDRRRAQVTTSGRRLRAELSWKARLGTRWMPTAQIGFGLQAHYRNSDRVGANPSPGELNEITRDMPFGGVLVVGAGLERQVGDMLLGIEFQVRQGVPADYRSVSVLLSWGCFLDQGD
jgi:hypothetical protein